MYREYHINYFYSCSQDVRDEICKNLFIQEIQNQNKWLNKNIMIFESCHYYLSGIPISHYLSFNFVWENSNKKDNKKLL